MNQIPHHATLRDKRRAWKTELDDLLLHYQKRISGLEAQRRAKKKFEDVGQFALDVTSNLHKCVSPHGLWQLAIDFACKTSELPPSGWLTVEKALLFACQFEFALVWTSRKSREFEELVQNNNYNTEAIRTVERWLQLQKLPDDAVGDMMELFRDLTGRESNTDQYTYLSKANGVSSLKEILFCHIKTPLRHQDHMSWWIQCLEWFHHALMTEGGEVQRDAENSRLYFQSTNHLVVHAAKHCAGMSLKTVKVSIDHLYALCNQFVAAAQYCAGLQAAFYHLLQSSTSSKIE